MSIPISYTISTKNYLLRIPNVSDIPTIFSASKYPGFNDGMAWDPPNTIQELQLPLEQSIIAWQNGDGYSFTIENKENKSMVGRVSIRKTEKADRWNVGFWTHPTMQNKGVMTEVLGSIITFGFQELQAKSIEACHALWNKASEKVLKNNGFIFEEYIEKGFLKHGKWIEENKLVIHFEDWKKSNASI